MKYWALRRDSVRVCCGEGALPCCSISLYGDSRYIKDIIPFCPADIAGQAITAAETHEGVSGVKDADDEDSRTVEEIRYEGQGKIADIIAVHIEHIKGLFALRPPDTVAKADHEQVEDDGQEADEKVMYLEVNAVQVGNDDRRQGYIKDNRRYGMKSAAPKKTQLL